LKIISDIQNIHVARIWYDSLCLSTMGRLQTPCLAHINPFYKLWHLCILLKLCSWNLIQVYSALLLKKATNKTLYKNRLQPRTRDLFAIAGV